MGSSQLEIHLLLQSSRTVFFSRPSVYRLEPLFSSECFIYHPSLFYGWTLCPGTCCTSRVQTWMTKSNDPESLSELSDRLEQILGWHTLDFYKIMSTAAANSHLGKCSDETNTQHWGLLLSPRTMCKLLQNFWLSFCTQKNWIMSWYFLWKDFKSKRVFHKLLVLRWGRKPKNSKMENSLLLLDWTAHSHQFERGKFRVLRMVRADALCYQAFWPTSWKP